MAKRKKETKKEESAIQETEVVIEEQIKEPVFTEKELILKEWQEFYKSNVVGKYRGTVEDGKTIFDFYTRFTGRPTKYNGCGSCTVNKITYMNYEYERAFGEPVL